MNIAFIGLGIMGSRMAANLAKSGVELTVFNRSKEAMNELVNLGAKSSNSINEAVKDADVVISMLSTPETVKSVFITESKAIQDMKNNALWIDCTTVNPSFSKEMKEFAETSKIRFIDAPVAGTKPHAENGELVFFVGGQENECLEVHPLFEMMGKKTMYLS